MHIHDYVIELYNVIRRIAHTESGVREVTLADTDETQPLDIKGIIYYESSAYKYLRNVPQAPDFLLFDSDMTSKHRLFDSHISLVRYYSDWDSSSTTLP